MPSERWKGNDSNQNETRSVNLVKKKPDNQGKIQLNQLLLFYPTDAINSKADLDKELKSEVGFLKQL